MDIISGNNSSGSVILKFTILLSLEALVGYAINAVDTFMVGRLGETSIAAVGIANQIFYILTFVFASVCNASAIFASQYWGRKDVKSLNMVTGISLIANVAVVLIFSIATVIFPKSIIKFFTNNPEVVAAGVNYLRIKGISFIATAITTSYLAIMKSTGKALFPLVINTLTLVFNIILNYILIFGKLGFPEMGVSGAATATCVLRYMECGILLAYIYAKRNPIAVGIKCLMGFDKTFAARFFRVSIPVIINEVIWSLGVVTYNWIYARMGVEAIAAFNICSSIEILLTMLLVGMVNTCSILVGNHIGADLKEKAFRCAGNFLGVTISGSILLGAILILCSKSILSFYSLSPVAYTDARYLMIVTGCILWVKVSNLMLISGIIRSGGDTRFSLFLELTTIWGVGIPLALIGAFIFHLPVYWVVLLAMSDEFVKMIGALKRFLSRRWINNIVSDPGTINPTNYNSSTPFL